MSWILRNKLPFCWRFFHTLQCNTSWTTKYNRLFLIVENAECQSIFVRVTFARVMFLFQELAFGCCRKCFFWCQVESKRPCNTLACHLVWNYPAEAFMKSGLYENNVLPNLITRRELTIGCNICPALFKLHCVISSSKGNTCFISKLSQTDFVATTEGSIFLLR